MEEHDVLKFVTGTVSQESINKVPTRFVVDNNPDPPAPVQKAGASNSALGDPPAQNPAAVNEDDDELSQLYNLANTILDESKSTNSPSDVNTTIRLFREALDRRLGSHALQSDSLRDLTGVRVTRSSLTQQLQDHLDQSLVLQDNVVSESDDVSMGTEGNTQGDLDVVTAAAWGGNEASEMSQIAKSTLAHFNQSTPLFSLDATSTSEMESHFSGHPLHQLLLSFGKLVEILYAQFCRADDMQNLDQAISLLRKTVDACPTSHAYRVDLLNSLSAMLATRFHRTGHQLDLREAVERCTGVLTATDDRGENHQLLHSATNLLHQFAQSGQRTDLETAIVLFRNGLVQLPVHHPNRISASNNLCTALKLRFEQSGKREDLDEAISLHRDILESISTAHPDRSMSLYNVANTLWERFEQSDGQEDLDESILFHREALKLRPAPHPERCISLNNFANALWTRFERSYQQMDMNEAISFHREAFELLPISHPHRVASLCNLAGAVQTRFDLSGQKEDLDEAISLNLQALELLPAFHPDRSGSLNNLSIMLTIRSEQSGQREDLDKAISLCQDALKLHPAPHPGRWMSLHIIANALWTRFEQSGQLMDMDEAISCHREALKLIPTSHSYRSTCMFNLASALMARFGQSDQQEDLDDAISLHREALDLQPAPHHERWKSLNNFANALWTRFERSGQQKDLSEAILLHQNALKLLPADHPHRFTSLNNLSAMLNTRFKQLGHREDLDEAISLCRDTLELHPAPHPGRSMDLNYLGNLLTTLFNQSCQQEDLNEAISIHREALELQPSTNPGQYIFLNNLASALNTRFGQSGQQPDLDEAILMYQEALQHQPAHHPDQSNLMNNLACALLTRFKQSGQQVDLDEAMSFHRKALDLPAPHPLQFMLLGNLANVLQAQFDQSGQLQDLDESILFHRKAVELWPASHPDQSSSLNNLANALKIQFEQSGKREYLDEAISLNRQALELRSGPHPLRSTTLSNLAGALIGRFDYSGQREDLDEAISFHREALELRPASHPDRSISLNNVGNALRIRFEKLGQSKDLDEAISSNQQALELKVTSPSLQSSFSNNLASALIARFNESRKLEDLDQAILLLRDALDLFPATHPFRPTSLRNLGAALGSRFDQTGQQEDLETAINTYHEALDTVVNGHSQTCGISAGLGETLMMAYSRTHEAEYLNKAMDAYRVAANHEASPVSDRFDAARSWARHADPRHGSALDAYQAAIELLPRLAMLSLDLQSRQQALTSGSDGLARDAAACAIRSGQYDKAVELLEEGRAVFWSQALQLRTPLMELRDAAPKLEEKLRHIAIALEQGSLRDASRSPSYIPQKVMSMEQEASRFHRLNNEWSAALEEVRRLDGFQDFLRPDRLSTLQQAAVNGPVVILNASETGCAALILTLTSVRHVPFANLHFKEVTKLVKLIRHAVKAGRGASLPESSRRWVEDLVQQMPSLSETLQMLRLPLERHVSRVSDMSRQPDDIFRYVLAVLWESVVEPVIQSLNLQKSDTPLNLWWCPTGPFVFLPIHAAGIFMTERTKDVSDYGISSYTPTISSLLSNIPNPTSNDPFKMMVVIQSSTPGEKPLPCTLDELQKIEAHVPVENLVKLVPGFVKDVLSNLQTASIAHFACHGQQYPRKPLESALLLQDGPLKVSQIMERSIPNASLAFLSACETAMGDESLPDEVIHLGATLLFAGFRGVVATMWSIADLDGPKVAGTFYESMFKETDSSAMNGPRPDTTQAARTLHLAVTKLRSENVPFIRWVPFIYLGR